MGHRINPVGPSIANKILLARDLKMDSLNQQALNRLEKNKYRLPLFMEDMSSMYGWWTKTPSGQKKNIFETELWLPLLYGVMVAFDLQKKRFGSRGLSPVSAKRSRKHLTHLELFLIDYVLNQEAPDELVFSPTTIDRHFMNFELAMKKNDKLENIMLEFNSLSNMLLGYTFQEEKRSQVLSLNYRIRMGRLEEIDGTLFRKKVLMDPIWEQDKEVVREQLILGKKHFVWNYNKKEIFSRAGRDSISFNQTGLEKHKQKFFCLDKNIVINQHAYKVRQLFSTRFLLPLVACAKKTTYS